MRQIFLIAFIILIPASLQARASWQSNKLREQKKWEKVQEKIDAIPLLEEKAEGDYEILGPVRGEDMLTNKKTAMYNMMRRKAYEMGADAVVEVKCKKMLNWFAQACEGFGIKYVEQPQKELPEDSIRF